MLMLTLLVLGTHFENHWSTPLWMNWKGQQWVPSGPFKKAMTMVYTRNDVHFNLGKWEVNQSKEHWGGKIGRSGAGLGVDLKERKHQENSNELIVLLCHWKGRNSQSEMHSNVLAQNENFDFFIVVVFKGLLTFGGWLLCSKIWQQW